MSWDALTRDQQLWLSQPTGQDVLDSVGGDVGAIDFAAYGLPTPVPVVAYVPPAPIPSPAPLRFADVVLADPVVQRDELAPVAVGMWTGSEPAPVLIASAPLAATIAAGALVQSAAPIGASPIVVAAAPAAAPSVVVAAPATPLPLAQVVTLDGVAMPLYVRNMRTSQGAYDALSAAQKLWLTQPAGQDALDAAGGDYSKVDFSAFDHPYVPVTLTQYGFPQRTAAEVLLMSREQLIAEHLLVPGDPNNFGFGGTVGVDPTNGAPARTLQSGIEQYADGSQVQGGYNAAADKARQVSLFQKSTTNDAQAWEGPDMRTIAIGPESFVPGDFARDAMDTSPSVRADAPRVTLAPGAADAVKGSTFGLIVLALVAALFILR